jgi:hypothetical protein
MVELFYLNYNILVGVARPTGWPTRLGITLFIVHLQ